MKYQISNIKYQKGFTLIEAVVATSVFAFVISSILGVYIATTQLDRKSRSQRAVAQNARFIMEFLGKEVRNGTINYASYSGGLVSGNDDLYLENQANVIEHLFLSGTNMVLNKNGDETNLNSSSVKVTTLKFYIQPVGQPYDLAKTYNQQPRVTVALGLSANYGTEITAVSTMNVQSTFATRSYPSRIVGPQPNPPPPPPPQGPPPPGPPPPPPPVSDCSGSIPVGSRCPDGTIYAGIAYGSTKMFTTNSSAPGNYTYAEAISYCDGLSRNSYTDWRQPDLNELRVMYDNITAIGGFDGWWHWSSTLASNGFQAYIKAMIAGNGTEGVEPITASNYDARCIRP